MKITITKEFEFAAAHFLKNYHGKCERLHGHTYKLLVTISGELDKNDLLLDFVILKNIVKKHIINHLDHYNLNDILDNPTTENLAIYIFKKLENLTELLKDEIHNQNLSDEIRQFLIQEDANSDIQHSQTFTKIELESITVYESPTSFVTIKK